MIILALPGPNGLNYVTDIIYAVIFQNIDREFIVGLINLDKYFAQDIGSQVDGKAVCIQYYFSQNLHKCCSCLWGL